jgi:NADH-quinone oxidoreductase subunit F
MSKALNRMTSGKGRKEDADYLTHIATNIQGRTICAFGEACSWPVLSFVKKFKDEFEARGAADEAAQLESNQKGTVNSAN